MIIPALRPPITTACPMCADLIRHGGWNAWWVSGARIPTRGCPHQCGYCTIPLMYPKALRMRLRPVDEVAQHISTPCTIACPAFQRRADEVLAQAFNRRLPTLASAGRTTFLRDRKKADHFLPKAR